MLPVVSYSGPSPWTAAEDLGSLIAPVDEALARYQPSHRYFLLDEGVQGEDDLPRRNLVSALIALENSRSPAGLRRAMDALIDWLRGPGEQEIKRSFEEWIGRVLMPQRFGVKGPPSMQPLEEVRTMLAERVKEWTRQWVEEGREQGIEQGLAEERRLLCRQAARKFDGETAGRLSGLLDGLTAPASLAEVGDWIIDCDTGEDLLARTTRMLRRP